MEKRRGIFGAFVKALFFTEREKKRDIRTRKVKPTNTKPSKQTTRKTTRLQALGAVVKGSHVLLFFVPAGRSRTSLRVAESKDGFNFSVLKHAGSVVNTSKKKINLSACTHFQVVSDSGDIRKLFCERKTRTKTHIVIAEAKNYTHWKRAGNITSLPRLGVLVHNRTENPLRYIPLGKSIVIARHKQRKRWTTSKKRVLSPRRQYFDKGTLASEYAEETDEGILLLYHSQHKNGFSVGAALFDKKNPEKLLWRADESIWETPEDWSEYEVEHVATVHFQNRFISYWQVAGVGIFGVSYRLPFGVIHKKKTLLLHKPDQNPLLGPIDNNWEAMCTFNPAAVQADGKVHLLYRAQGFNYISSLGYAVSADGLEIDERLSEPVYVPQETFEYPANVNKNNVAAHFMSGGSWGGSEDPRATIIDGMVYLTYVAFDGYNPPRIALSKIALEDFLNKRWLWERPVLISPPGVVDKSCAIFPEKINGKYVILHRIYPNILIDFVDNLDFDGKTWLQGQYKIRPRKDMWDSRKIGCGAPPIKTKDGWLLIYQAVGNQDSGRYKVGAMLLDFDDPTKVLYRSASPILEPEEWYENEGFKYGVVYPCGAAVIDNTLYVYYGGSDSHVCVATAYLPEFLHNLKNQEENKL